MDTATFDRLCRQLGSRARPRRAVLRLLAGVGLALGTTRLTPPVAQAAITCHWDRCGRVGNKFRRCCPGTLCQGGRCLRQGCLLVGEYCRRGGTCCDGAVCNLAQGSQVCTCPEHFYEDSRGHCQPCQFLGSTCAGANACCSGIGPGPSCREVSFGKNACDGFPRGDLCIQCGQPGQHYCCAEIDRPCTNTCDCCGSLICDGGTCRACTRAKGVCGEGTRCCAPASGCGLVDRLKQDGTACPRNLDLPDAPVCCVADAKPCRESCECCSGLICSGGTCVQPYVPPPCTDSTCRQGTGEADPPGPSSRPRKRDRRRRHREEAHSASPS